MLSIPSGLVRVEFGVVDDPAQSPGCKTAVGEDVDAVGLEVLVPLASEVEGEGPTAVGEGVDTEGLEVLVGLAEVEGDGPQPANNHTATNPAAPRIVINGSWTTAPRRTLLVNWTSNRAYWLRAGSI